MSVRSSVRSASVALLVALLLLPPASAAANTIVRLATNLGDIDIELFDDETPNTVANFLDYVSAGPAPAGGYDGSMVHRSATVASSGVTVIQGGGFFFDSPNREIDPIPTGPPVANEFNRSNLRGTVAMARLGGQPDSATSQWFVNVLDNPVLDGIDGGFTVFGQVIAGLEVVDQIAGLPRIDATLFGSAFGEVPVIDFDSDAADPIAEFEESLVLVNTAAIVPEPTTALLLGAGLAALAARRR